MNKQLAATLIRAKESGIREGIDACCRVLCVAFYDAACDKLPDMADAEKGRLYAQMRTEMLEILRQGARDTYPEEMEYAVQKAREKMEVTV
ncbi:MAG: hypothetical protein RSE54_04125 [Ruthenibacterium sp.]